MMQVTPMQSKHCLCSRLENIGRMARGSLVVCDEGWRKGGGRSNESRWGGLRETEVREEWPYGQRRGREEDDE
jgi:hypothetical protein